MHAMLLGALDWRFAAYAAVRPHLVGVEQTCCDLLMPLAQPLEPAVVQTLVAITTQHPDVPVEIRREIKDLRDSKELSETAPRPAAPSYEESSDLRRGDGEKQAQRGEGAPAGNEGLKARIAREADGYVAPLITNEKSPTAGNSAKIAKSAITTQRPDVQVEIYREINDLRDSKELSETAPRHAAPSYEENSELRRSDDEKQAQGGGGARAAKPWLHLGNL